VEGWCWGRPYSIVFSLNCSELSIGVKACLGFGFGLGSQDGQINRIYHQGLWLSLPTFTRIITLHFFYISNIFFGLPYITFGW